jgi:3-deoxy-D-manno-octulosonic-acid transferase
MTAADLPMTALLRVYRAVTGMVPGLVLRPVLRAHARQGADPARLRERHGQATVARPAGRLVWVHAASVGEFLAVRDLIADLAAARPHIAILVTTATATGAAAVARAGFLHQFLPADTPEAVARFLDHWRPGLAVIAESDIWPNLVVAAAERGVRLALVNARPSRTRARLGRSMGALLARFGVVTAQDPSVAAGIVALGVPAARVAAVGDLKADAVALPDDSGARKVLAEALAGRAVWAAVSTHAADEGAVLEAQAAVAQAVPGAVCLWVPRHPDRAGAIREACAARGLAVAQRSRGESLGPGTGVYLADTIGETGVFFRLAGVVFLGGSFGDEGGHNPFEPLRLGAALLHGPGVRHFTQAYARMDAEGAAKRVADGAGLGAAVVDWLTDEVGLSRAVAAGGRVLGDMGGARGRTVALLLALADGAD